MSIDWQLDVTNAHRLLRPNDVGETPRLMDVPTLDRRLRLIDEEYNELRSALVNEDIAGAVDGMGDLIYVVVGAAVAMGVDLTPVWNAIHAANIAKAGGGLDANGKWKKPPGWAPPDIAGILSRQRPLSEIYPEAEAACS